MSNPWWQQFLALAVCVLWGWMFEVSSAQSIGELRLIGDNERAGRLEVYLNDAWGTICSDGFGAAEATVACHQLGYATSSSWGTALSLGYESGEPQQSIWLDEVTCSTDALLHLLQCSNSGMSLNSCQHSQDVAVQCDSSRIWEPIPYSGHLRLQSGSYPSEGRVEIYFNGEWGTVCNRVIDTIEATTICRQLGYTHATDFMSASTDGSYASAADAGTPVWLDGVQCFTAYNCLSRCASIPRSEVMGCSHGQDLTIQCAFSLGDGSVTISAVETTTCNNFTSDYSAVPSNGEVRLVGAGSSQTEGRLEVYLNNKWSSFCSNGFGVSEANVACRQLGYGGADRYENATSEGFGMGFTSSPVFDVSCSVSSELHLLRCEVSGSRCDHSDDVAVYCLDTPIWDPPYRYEGQIRLEGGSYPSKGRVEIFVNDAWGAVCNEDGFGADEADSGCRQLGFTGGEFHNSLSLPGSAGLTYWLRGVSCDGVQSCLANCIVRPSTQFSECSAQPATVQCTFDELSDVSSSNSDTCELQESRLFTNLERIALVTGSTFVGTVLLTLVVVGCCYWACKRQQDLDPDPERNQIAPAGGGTAHGTDAQTTAAPRAPPAVFTGRPTVPNRLAPLPPIRQDRYPAYPDGGLNLNLAMTAALPPGGQGQQAMGPPPDYPGPYMYNGTQL